MAREVAHRVETREEVKQHTGHIIPSHAIVHVSPNTHIFNGSDHRAYVEVSDAGELLIKPLDFGQLVISFGDPEEK